MKKLSLVTVIATLGLALPALAQTPADIRNGRSTILANPSEVKLERPATEATDASAEKMTKKSTKKSKKSKKSSKKVSKKAAKAETEAKEEKAAK